MTVRKTTRVGTKTSVKPKRKASGKAKAKPHSKAKLSRAQRKVAKPKTPVRSKANAAATPAKKAPRKPVKKTAAKVSPLAPRTFAKLPAVEGVVLGTVAAGIKYKGRTDLLVAKMVEGTQAAGVFTTSKTASAPVEWCKSSLADGGEGRMLVVNSGNSNAFTGKAGVATVKATAAAAAQAGGCRWMRGRWSRASMPRWPGLRPPTGTMRRAPS
jgi:glutamate N-acetyltransferase/amino-acid N-acetyltransferase